MVVPDQTDERWSMDIVSDQLANGRRLRILNVVDGLTRLCVLQVVDFSEPGEHVTQTLDQPARSRPPTSTLVCDNGPEFTSEAMFYWAHHRGVKLHFIQPGEPTQNAFVNSFIGKFRDYSLNINWFANLEDARSTISRGRDHYKTVRPRRSLDHEPPAVFAREAA